MNGLGSVYIYVVNMDTVQNISNADLNTVGHKEVEFRAVKIESKEWKD